VEELFDSNLNTLFDVSNKVVIVTGGGRGNGLAIAEGLSKLGAKVIRIDLSFDAQSNGFDFRFNLENLSEIPALIVRIHRKFGVIDGLINNAGISLTSNDPYNDNDAYVKTLNINLHAAFELCANVCPIMAKQGSGSIINVTSLGAELGFPNNPSYQISKAGLRQATKAIARDWGSSNVRVNNLCPGYIKTSMTSKSYSDPVLNKERTNKMLIKRWGEPADLVGPAAFLLSDASSYITGSDIYVDGGWTSNGGL
jgi:NAD(P)-dependent dehydrogenase (short-subunit alcohol dehydrogenase family)